LNQNLPNIAFPHALRPERKRGSFFLRSVEIGEMRTTEGERKGEVLIQNLIEKKKEIY